MLKYNIYFLKFSIFVPSRMHENKRFFFENRVFLISDLYFYDIKIQTNLSLNDIKKSVGKSQIKKHRYIIKKTRTKKEKIINRINWTGLGLYWTSHKAGLSPAAWAGLMFQPLVNRAGLSPVAREGISTPNTPYLR
jgi:hypothetical protein